MEKDETYPEESLAHCFVEFLELSSLKKRVFFGHLVKTSKNSADKDTIGRHEEPLSWGVFDMLGKICFVLTMIALACCVTVLSWFGWVHGVSWSRRKTCSPYHE